MRSSGCAGDTARESLMDTLSDVREGLGQWSSGAFVSGRTRKGGWCDDRGAGMPRGLVARSWTPLTRA